MSEVILDRCLLFAVRSFLKLPREPTGSTKIRKLQSSLGTFRSLELAPQDPKLRGGALEPEHPQTLNMEEP